MFSESNIAKMKEIVKKLSLSEVRNSGNKPLRKIPLTSLDLATIIVNDMRYNDDGYLSDENIILLNSKSGVMLNFGKNHDRDTVIELNKLLLQHQDENSVLNILINRDDSDLEINYTKVLGDNGYVWVNTMRRDNKAFHAAKQKYLSQGYLTYKDIRLVASGLIGMQLQESNKLFDHVIDNIIKDNMDI